MSRAFRDSLIALLCVAAGVSAGVWMLGSALSAPAQRQLGPAPPALAAEAVAFPSQSGGTIRAWLVRGTPGGGVVVLAHSVRANRLELVDRALFLRRAGYSALLFDAQAHGESAGDRITFGYREALDARAAVAWVRERFPGEPMGYLGLSQGGAAALLGPAPLPVQALILEAVYPTLREAVVARIAIRLGALAPYVAPLLLLQVGPRLGVDVDALAPIERIGQIRAPLLLIAGDRDRHTPLAASQRLFDAAPEPKQMWIVRGAAHVDFHRAAPAEYEQRVTEFLDHALHRGPDAKRRTRDAQRTARSGVRELASTR